MSDQSQQSGRPFGSDNLGDEISQQVLEDTDSSEQIDSRNEIAKETARQFDEKSRFGGEGDEDEFEQPDHDSDKAKG